MQQENYGTMAILLLAINRWKDTAIYRGTLSIRNNVSILPFLTNFHKHHGIFVMLLIDHLVSETNAPRTAPFLQRIQLLTDS
jgi:hypothetical protein